jgi:hypothetical protein
VNESQDPIGGDPGRTRAVIGLGALTAAAVAEGRFRVLQAEALTRIATPFGGDSASVRDAVAAWHVAGRLAEPWIQALVIGGLVAAIAVSVRRQSAPRRGVWTLVCAALVYSTWIGLGTAAPAADLFERTDASFSRWLQPIALAGSSSAASAISIWCLAPLAVSVAKSRAAWALVALALGVTAWHATTLFARGEPPQHQLRRNAEWFVVDPRGAERHGALRLDRLGAVHLEPAARIAAVESTADELHAWIVRDADAREVSAQRATISSDENAHVLIDARWIADSVQTSTRSTPDAPSLITIAVDGLRSRDLAEWLQARTAPPAIQRCAEAGVFFPTLVVPTADPRLNEAALLSGDHPASRGRAPIAQHLGAVLNAAGFASQQISEGVPRAGVSGGFAVNDMQCDADVVRTARRYLASHAEERFHLHITMERLALEATWDAEVLSAPRPETGESLDDLRNTARARIAERSVRAERHADDPAIDVAWRAWFDAAHRARTRELLVEFDALFADLEAHDLVERCVIVLVGTSGIALGEHGSLGFGQDLHAESVRVPLLARGPGLPNGERRAGLRDATLVAGALANLCQVAWPGREATWDWTAREAQPRPIFLRATSGVWNGVPDREILALIARDHVLLWCPAAERDVGLLPGHGPWSMFRIEDDPAETIDLALVQEFMETTIELRAELRVRAESVAAERRAAERPLEDWRAVGAWTPEATRW